MKPVDFHEVAPFEILALWEVEDPFLVFDNFIVFNFNAEIQWYVIQNNMYTNEELKYLLHIYILMDQYRRDTYTVENEIVLWNKTTDYIKKIIIKLLSLPSMERYMKEIRKNSYYKWIWDFY